ncbi:MAG: DNA primase, partial [Oscillospiraceae bacterium]|nr:DNA primase [Oscillospiraceae bacterium]
MYHDFPFTIKEVAGVLSLTIRHGENGNSTDVDCPFCKRKGKMNLNSLKDVFRCNYCGENGGMTRLYGAVHNISNADAYREICELLGCDGKNPGNYEGQVVSHTKKPEQPKRADSISIHQTYSMLLSLLSLASTHKDQLMDRGLSPDDVAKIGYRSVPAFGQQDLCRRLIESGCAVEGVPGFFKVVDDNGTWNGAWDLKLRAPGVLIPVHGIDGKITALQIRLNKPVNDRKYIWFSSTGKVGGTSSGSPIHFVGDPTARRVYVTEGPLKGTIAHKLTRYPFICLPSANS